MNVYQEQWNERKWFFTDKYLLVLLDKSYTFKCCVAILCEMSNNTDLTRKKGSPFEETRAFVSPLQGLLLVL